MHLHPRPSPQVYELSADVCGAARDFPELLKCLQVLNAELYPSAGSGAQGGWVRQVLQADDRDSSAHGVDAGRCDGHMVLGMELARGVHAGGAAAAASRLWR